MAASTKFDFSSGSAGALNFPNGQRVAYASVSMERSGSFREGTENRSTSSLPSTLRSGSMISQDDLVATCRSLLSDLKSMVFEQKFPRSGELKRVVTAALGISLDEPLSTVFLAKTLPASSIEELKWVKANLHDSSMKARDRAKVLGEAASKIDIYYQNVLPRKRSRSDSSSSERLNSLLPGGSTSKLGSQNHPIAFSLELGPQKSEDKTKTAVPNRRIRSSMLEVRANGVSRPSRPMKRDSDKFKLVTGDAISSEDKVRALPTGVDGWEKSKMKKKRSGIKSDVSVSATFSRTPEDDHEPKRGMQQRFGNDVQSKLINSHGFRSGPASGAIRGGKLDLSSQQNSSIRPPPKRDQNNVSFSNDGRKRLVASDKESGTPKTINKTVRPNVCEENSTSNPASVTKVNGSARAFRSSSGVLCKASPGIHRAMAGPDDWEFPQCTNKLNTIVGANNRKRSASTCSSSSPVTQWVGQRPQKMSRVARRSNILLVSSQDEVPVSDLIENAAIYDEGSGTPKPLSSNASQELKTKGDHASLAGLSESEESGVPENKSKDKGKKYTGVEEKGAMTLQKVATPILPSRKNKMAAEEDNGDGVRRQGRTGRSYTPTRSGVPPRIEKIDDAATAKQLKSVRFGSEKIESKPGRPPTKKFSERKGNTRPRLALKHESTEFAGESYDDHEELLAAANSALNISSASSSKFWKQVEPIFCFLSAEDIAYLKEQGAFEYGSISSTPGHAYKDGFSGIMNGIGMNECERELGLASETKHVEPFLEQLLCETGTHNGISICQVLLSAMIEEIENIYCSTNNEEECFNSDRYGIQFGIDTDLKYKDLNLHALQNFQAVERTPSNGYRVNASWKYHDELENGSLDNDDYSQMCVDSRILLELSDIGLYPEPVPDLALSEDEEIDEGISRLEAKLHKQLMKRKSILEKLDKAVEKAKEHQERELERIAVDRLIMMAYDKLMACQGLNTSGSKSANKITKHAALAFVKRTLARCQKFEETGISCFNEPAFRNIFLSLPSYSNNAEHMETDRYGEAANPYSPAQTSESILKDHTSHMPELDQKVDGHDKCSPDAYRSINHLPEQKFGKEDPGSNRVKKRELLLDDVVGISARASSGPGNSLVSGTKGKRSERERDGKGHNRDTTSRYGTTRIGRTTLTDPKGDRKNKLKPKQKTTQLSASLNGLLGNTSDLLEPLFPSVSKSREMSVAGNVEERDGPRLLPIYPAANDMSNDEAAIDLSNLQLPVIDVLGVPDDFDGQGQDIDSWLSIDDDALQDQDFMGLGIPMDDLSELNMML